MAKKITIECCDDCPYYSLNGRICKQTKDVILDNKPNEHCPLEDAKED